MKCAYADPPYIGCARLYEKVDANAAEVDHAALIARLELEYPEGWALSLHVPSLRTILNLCAGAGLDDGTYRIGAWVKPFAVFKPNVTVAYAWEPVIFRGGRARTREQPTVRDWVAANITLRKGMPGAKPPAFCRWVFEVLNLQAGDELSDLFPGSGAVTEAWEGYAAQREPAELELLMQGPITGEPATVSGEPRAAPSGAFAPSTTERK